MIIIMISFHSLTHISNSCCTMSFVKCKDFEMEEEEEVEEQVWEGIGELEQWLLLARRVHRSSITFTLSV